MSNNYGFSNENEKNVNYSYQPPQYGQQQTPYPNQPTSYIQNQAPPYSLQNPVKVQPTNLNEPVKGNVPNELNISNVEAGAQWGNFEGLTDKVVRIKFIRKVYLILTLQLVFTFGIVSIFVFVKPVKAFAQTTPGLIVYLASYVLFVVLIILFSFCSCTKGLRKVPYNYILLGAITVSLTYMLGMISAYHKIEAVLIAIGITFAITIGVTLVACQTKYDFTNCWLVMVCLCFAFLGFGIACAISYRYIPILQAVYGGIGAIIMSLFLAIDTQLLMGNKKYAYSPEDYINAALQLYLDICYIFLYLLQMLGAANK